MFTLLFGALAGYGAQLAEPKITEMLLKYLGQNGMIADQDRSVAALFICLIPTALILDLLGYGGITFVFILAAGLGYFQYEVREFVMSKLR